MRGPRSVRGVRHSARRASRRRWPSRAGAAQQPDPAERRRAQAARELFSAGGSTNLHVDGYAAGEIRFFPNRYGTDLASELKERAFAALPGLAWEYCFVRSMLER